MEGFVKHISVALKGFFMGAANIVPGVSGGTIALISGIFSDIIESLNALMSPGTWKLLLHGQFKEFWEKINGGFLLSLVIGVLLSIFSLAKLLGICLVKYPVATWAFFFGLILASAFFMIREVKGWGWKDSLILIAGIALGLVVCTLSPTDTPDGLWFIFICGAIAICTMILPGISGSFILVILGKYDYILNAVSNLEWGALIVFGLGCVVGILAFSKLLHWLLARWERQTMLVLVGFVLGSLVKVWPWANVPEGTSGVGSAVVLCLAGIAIIVAIEAAGKKHKLD